MADSPSHRVDSQPPSTEDIDSEWATEPEAEPAPELILPASVVSEPPLATVDATPISVPPQRSEIRELLRPKDNSNADLRRSSEPRFEDSASESVGSGRSWFGWPTAALLLLVTGAVWFMMSRGRDGDAPKTSARAVQSPAPNELRAEKKPDSAPEGVAAPAALPSPLPEKPTLAAPTGSAVSPGAAGSAVPLASAEAPSTERIRVVLKLRPPDAKVYWKGKEVGTTIELAPGEKRAFEVGKPGYTTRKVRVDGTQSEISVGLQPIPAR